MYNMNSREEEIKNLVGRDYFSYFNTTRMLGNIDFSVFPNSDKPNSDIPLLWAEVKANKFDLTKMFVQLILTIGKARTFDRMNPPTFLCVFDCEKISFVPYINIQQIFNINDFNWNVTASNHNTKEFSLLKERVEENIKTFNYTFYFGKDDKELKHFIANNVAKSKTKNKINIDKNNFIPIYLRWLETIKPLIEVDWEAMKSINIIDSDFYLADIFVEDNDTVDTEDDITVRNNLFVVYKNQGYNIAKENLNQVFDANIFIKDKNVYRDFWKKYKRPPMEQYQEFIIQRRDLLVPQDIRERKGAFFTPRKWVELSQKYLTEYLGENWQEEYYIWECACGTGNLLTGLTNKYNIYGSTLDQADVNVVHDRIDNGANLLKKHIFQFDFLNDSFDKLPQSLQDIINDEEKRRKLVIYINPPYAEGDNVKGIGRKDVHISKVHEKYQSQLGKASSELFAQFFMRIYKEIPNAILAEFSTLKILQAPNFLEFRKKFQAKLESLFIVPADTFDNVKGKFPIGFFIWNTSKQELFESTVADVYDSKANFVGTKTITTYDGLDYISDWLANNSKKISNEYIGHLASVGNDFQNQRMIFLDNNNNKGTWKKGGRHTRITAENLLVTSIYYTVRHNIPATWLNDRDQFLFPNENWEFDKEFQNDCLAFTLFNNNISSSFGTNNWIPFTEHQVNASERFESNFMTNYIKENNLEFSKEAKYVFEIGLDLWRYYHIQQQANPNASYYDIREFFQGRNAKGKMNNKSEDLVYMDLLKNLKDAQAILATKITPKIYEYEFLK